MRPRPDRSDSRGQENRQPRREHRDSCRAERSAFGDPSGARLGVCIGPALRFLLSDVGSAATGAGRPAWLQGDPLLVLVGVILAPLFVIWHAVRREHPGRGRE